MPWLKSKLLGVAVAATLGACGSTTSTYVETTPEPVATTQEAPRFPVSRYSIPEDSPEGTIEITSFGVLAIEPGGPSEPSGAGPPSDALHVRVVLANERGDQPWIVDTRELLLALPGEGESRPAFVNTDAGTPPIIHIQPGAERTLDLFYPLPADVKGNDDVASFTLRWAVVTGKGRIARRTPFEREPVSAQAEPYYPSDSYAPPVEYPYDYWTEPYYSIGVGFGTYPYWYYDPFYPGYTFYSVPPIVAFHSHIVHAPRPVHIARPPAALAPVRTPSFPGGPGPGPGHHVGRPGPAPMPSHATPGPSAPAPAPSHIAQPPTAPPMHAPMPSPPPPAPAPPPAAPPTHIAVPPR